jgi:hypothetical protein
MSLDKSRQTTFDRRGSMERQVLNFAHSHMLTSVGIPPNSC